MTNTRAIVLLLALAGVASASSADTLGIIGFGVGTAALALVMIFALAFCCIVAMNPDDEYFSIGSNGGYHPGMAMAARAHMQAYEMGHVSAILDKPKRGMA